jgi:signal transduction histidine kinase
MFESPLLITFLLFILGAVQIALGSFVIWRRGFGEWPIRLLVVTTIVSGLWDWIQGLGLWIGPLSNGGILWIDAYILIGLAVLFFYLTRSFLRLPGVAWTWGLIAIAGGALVTLLLRGLLPLPADWLNGAPTLGLGLAFICWAAYLAGSINYTVRAYQAASQALHRNRLLYWFLVLALVLVTDLFFFITRSPLDSLFRVIETAAVAYIVVNHRLPDVRRNARRTAAYLIVGFVAALIYVLIIIGLESILRDSFRYNEWLTWALTFLLVAVLAHPLVQLFQYLVIQRLAGAAYDSTEAVGNYSASISNILNIERLAEKVTGLISETMSAETVRLFLVDHKRIEGRAAHRLRVVTHPNQTDPLEGTLSADNPMAVAVSIDGLPLSQYDLDLLPRYRKMPEAERQWLTSLRTDVYVPIHNRGHWIGLLTLGPKTTRDRYFQEDLTLLDTLADQTAIALENARLVSDLVSLNKDIKQAFADLEKAHNQLNELDRLKSAFIGAITHELRTPVANIQFSIQLIEKYGVQNMAVEQQEQFFQLIDAAKHAKTMVDNLVNFATFLGKQGDLKLSEFSFSELLGENVVMLEPHARRKDVTLLTDVADEGLPLVMADRPRLSDACYHLIQNAIKFTGAGGRVTARCWAKDGNLFFEVEDNGVGVPPDRLESLWDGFSQMADPLKRGLEGLGLGLALVKYVVTAHDGEVQAASTGVAGEGSSFGFRIPITGPKPMTKLTEDALAEVHKETQGSSFTTDSTETTADAPTQD